MPQPDPGSYRRALIAARENAFQHTRTGAERQVAAYAEALRAIVRDRGTERITAERAEGLRRELYDALAALERQFAGITAEAMVLTLDDTARIHEAVNRKLLQQQGVSMATDFNAVPRRAVAAMAARSEQAATFRSLYKYRVEQRLPEIDTFLRASVARGVGAGEGTRDLARLLGGNLSQFRKLADMLPSSSRLHRNATVNLSKYGLSEADTKQLRTLLYDARRIHVSETSNALRQANTDALIESPIVEAARWALSGNHPPIPCACEVFSRADLYGYGPGFFPVARWPLAPHPLCQCSQSGTIFRPVQDWNKPKAAARALQADPADSQWYAGYEGKVTEKALERIRANVVQGIREVEPKQRRAA